MTRCKALHICGKTDIFTKTTFTYIETFWAVMQKKLSLAISYFVFHLLEWRGPKSHFASPKIQIEIIRVLKWQTGCPTILGPLCFLLFCQLLLYQNTKVGWVLQYSGNLLHDRHKNFENWFRISWDIWGQRWHPLFRNWHFIYYYT